MNRASLIKKGITSLIFFFIQVVLPLSILKRINLDIPFWIVQFACYWGFSYLMLMLWFNRTSANRISLISFLLFLVLSTMKLIQFEQGFMSSISTIGVSIISILKGPALVALSMGLAYLMNRKSEA